MTTSFIFFMLQVDGLPGLILGSGTVVAVGREPFRPAMYNAQKSPARARQHTKPVGFRRKKAFNRKLIYESSFQESF